MHTDPRVRRRAPTAGPPPRQRPAPPRPEPGEGHDADRWGWTSPYRSQRAQARQNFLAVQLQELCLVRAGGVEDEVGEAEVEIGLDLLDVFVGISGDDEPLRGLVDRQLVGQPLHLDRVLDAVLL